MKTAERYVEAAEEYMGLAQELASKIMSHGGESWIALMEHHRDMAHLNLELARIAGGV